jgi:protein SCO1/2
VKPVFISVDPARDSLKQLKHYAKGGLRLLSRCVGFRAYEFDCCADFHPEIVFLTGTPDQVAKACRQYRVYFSKADINADDEEDYLVDHSIVLYLVRVFWVARKTLFVAACSGSNDHACADCARRKLHQQNGPDGQFIDFFTQSMKVEDIVAKIGNYVKAGVGQPQPQPQPEQANK